MLDGMGKKPVKTVPIHARLPVPDVAEVDAAAAELMVSRSLMVALIVRQWSLNRSGSHGVAMPGIASPGEAVRGNPRQTTVPPIRQQKRPRTK